MVEECGGVWRARMWREGVEMGGATEKRACSSIWEDKDNAGGEESDALQEEGGYGNGRNRPNTSGQWVAYQKHAPENLGAWYTYIQTNYVSASQARVSRKTLYTRAFV